MSSASAAKIRRKSYFYYRSERRIIYWDYNIIYYRLAYRRLYMHINIYTYIEITSFFIDQYIEDMFGMHNFFIVRYHFDDIIIGKR